jgi:Flp pilus assembly protein TadG
MFERLSGKGRRASRFSRRGTTAVEFSLTAPIALLFTFGCIEFARVHMIINSAENAAYEGARRGILPGATSEQAATAATRHLSATLVNVSTATVEPTVITPTTKTVTVTTRVPVGSNLWITPFFFRNTTIERSCTLKKELSDL